MKHMSISRALRDANPVPTHQPLDAQGRVELARHVHPSLVVMDDARGAARPGRRHPVRWAAAVTGTAVLVASAVVLWPGQAPPAQAEVVTGKVVAATAPSGGQDGDDWSASAITELTAPDGTKSYVRAWSRSGELTAQEGDVLTYKELPDTKWIVSEEGTSLLVSSLPSVSLTLGKTEVGVSVGEGEASGTAEGSGPTSASVFVSGSLESDGIGTMSVLAERDNDAVFYVLASGDDLTGARALLEALELTPEGEWAEAPTGAELASPADAAREIAGQFADDGPQGSGGVSESGEDGVVSRTEGVG